MFVGYCYFVDFLWVVIFVGYCYFVDVLWVVTVYNHFSAIDFFFVHKYNKCLKSNSNFLIWLLLQKRFWFKIYIP